MHRCEELCSLTSTDFGGAQTCNFPCRSSHQRKEPQKGTLIDFKLHVRTLSACTSLQ